MRIEDLGFDGQTAARWSAGIVGPAIVIGAHLHVEAVGPDYSGMLLFLDRIYDVGLAVGLVILASSLGNSVVERLNIPDSSTTERWLFATAIGIGVEGTAVLILGAASLFNGWTVALLFALLAWVGRRQLARFPDRLRGMDAELRESMGPWVLLLLGIIGAFLFVQSGTPPSDWDALMYHLDVPREYLDAGRVFLPADNHHSAFVGLQHMLYIPLLAAGAASGPAVVSAVIALLLGLSVYVVGERLFDRTTGRLAAIFLWGSPIVVLVAVTSRVDVTMTWMLVLVHFALLVCLERTRVDGWYWIAAVIAGLAVATKFSALVYLVGLSPLVAWLLYTTSQQPIRQGWKLVGFAATVAAVAAPWLVKNLVLLGAPFYPYLTEIQLEPWLADYLGTSTVPQSIDPAAFRLPRQIREPFSLLALFTNPASMTDEREGWFYFGNLVLLLLPLSVFVSRRKNSLLLLPPLLYVALILCVDRYINLRYLVPALIVGTLVASHLVSRAGQAAFSTPALRRVFWGCVALPCLLLTGGAMYQRLEEMRPYEYWLGLVSEEDYLHDNDNPDVTHNARVREHVNRSLPPGSRVVMLFESRGYGYKPTVIRDNLMTSWRVLAHHRAWRDCLEPTGATHVLVNYGQLSLALRRGLEVETAGWNSFAVFARRCLKKDATVANTILYRIEPGS